jgi:CrcB protein
MLEFVFVGVGGFLGACSRFAITKFMNSVLPFFPFGTLLSNVIAGLCIGFIMGLSRGSVEISDSVKLFLTVGLLGGLSTFSTFSIETVSMFESGNYTRAGVNILSNVCISLAFTVIGLYLARLVVKG